MKYSDYQVWYHSYNNAITAFGRRDEDTSKIIEAAKQAADVALKKFEGVEHVDNDSMKDILSQVTSDLLKKRTGK